MPIDHAKITLYFIKNKKLRFFKYEIDMRCITQAVTSGSCEFKCAAMQPFLVRAHWSEGIYFFDL
jgi:hypothetical protein